MPFILILFVGLVSTYSAQNPEGFDKMVGRMVKGTVPYISAMGLESLPDSNLYILDTREREEYAVGHLPDAIYVGYKDLDEAILATIPIDATVVTYCSIGYRSEKIGMRLMASGHENVYNLKGGVFDWVNNGYPLHDSSTRVHGYSKKWSKWVNTDRIHVVTDPVRIIAE